MSESIWSGGSVKKIFPNKLLVEYPVGLSHEIHLTETKIQYIYLWHKWLLLGSKNKKHSSSKWNEKPKFLARKCSTVKCHISLITLTFFKSKQFYKQEAFSCSKCSYYAKCEKKTLQIDLKVAKSSELFGARRLDISSLKSGYLLFILGRRTIFASTFSYTFYLMRHCTFGFCFSRFSSSKKASDETVQTNICVTLNIYTIE